MCWPSTPRWTPRAVGASPQAQVKGEIWVAKDGGYVISYILEINGAADDWGKGVEGVMRWKYNLETVGQPLGLLPSAGLPVGDGRCSHAGGCNSGRNPTGELEPDYRAGGGRGGPGLPGALAAAGVEQERA